jgi:hypothetical protein
MTLKVVGRQKNWFNTCTTSAVPPGQDTGALPQDKCGAIMAKLRHHSQNAPNRDFECNGLLTTVVF